MPIRPVGAGGGSDVSALIHFTSIYYLSKLCTSSQYHHVQHLGGEKNHFIWKTDKCTRVIEGFPPQTVSGQQHTADCCCLSGTTAVMWTFYMGVKRICSHRVLSFVVRPCDTD